MSDYARFVRAVADNTRDVAMDNLLEENQTLKDRNEELEAAVTQLREESTRHQQAALEFGATLQEAQDRNNEMGERTNALHGRVDALMIEANTNFDRMRHIIIDLELECSGKRAELAAEIFSRKKNEKVLNDVIEYHERRCRFRGILCAGLGLCVIGLLAVGRPRK